MSRATTTSDVFNAVAEPRRREIIRVLANGRAHSVNELVAAMDLAQSAVSKHLGVLKAVGIVSVQQQGKQRLYSLNAAQLKPVHDWVKPFEQYWTQQLDRVKQRAERKAAERAAKN